jgi:hypothetical protein
MTQGKKDLSFLKDYIANELSSKAYSAHRKNLIKFLIKKLTIKSQDVKDQSRSNVIDL